MSGIRFRTEHRQDIFLYRTEVENLFINEYLPSAPGDYVKVFLFGLMCAQIGEKSSSDSIAFTLGLTGDAVAEAWRYWEAKGLVRISDADETGMTIEFVRQVDLLYGKMFSGDPGDNAGAAEKSEEDTAAAETKLKDPAEGSGADAAEETGESTAEGYIIPSSDGSVPEADAADDVRADDLAESEDIISRLIDRQLQYIFEKYERTAGRTISPQEIRKLTDAVRLYNIEPDVLDFAISYCADIEKYSVDYIFKVALRWTSEGCRDVVQVKTLLDARSQRNDYYRKVFAALGFTRLAAPADREIMDKWIDEMGFTVREVLDACGSAAGLRDPNLRYVAKVLENRMLERGGINTRNKEAASGAGNGKKRIFGDAKEDKSDGIASDGRSRGESKDDSRAKVSRKVLRDYYEYLRNESEKERRARIDEVRQKIPEMKAVLAAEAEINRSVISIIPGSSAPDRRRSLREKRQEIENEKRELLVRSGRPADYLERHYRCRICRDTGYTDEGRVCTCAAERAEEAYRWILKTGKN